MEADNVERYDRQIRLWGQHGQSKCSNSKICLINADSLGTEILRGLCLAGIGSFTILDSHKLTPEDVGCSFLPLSCVGKSRAESVRNMLLDLNEEVSGEVHTLESYLPHLTQSNPLDCESSESSDKDLGFWRQFNCVIASGVLYIDQIARLSRICWALTIPLILCKSIGFYGSMSSQIREHLVIETHPDNILPDFSLYKPFKELEEYFRSIDLSSNSRLDKQGTYPYVIILYKYLKIWQQSNGLSDDSLPNSYTEKNMIKQLILQDLKELTKREKHLGKEGNEGSQEILLENFLEAAKAINPCFSISKELPDSVKAIFDSPKLSDDSGYRTRFWLIIQALKEFVLNKNDGRLPVSGNIPDMTSSSEEYINLQKIYAKKAKEDIESVFGLVQTSINSPNRSPGSSLFDETKLICKNIRDLKVITTRPIHEEYDFKAATMKEEDDVDEFLTIGLCLKALDLFFSTYGRLPGCQDDQVETDVSKLKDCLRQILGRNLNKLKTLDQCLYELCRYGGAELHATSAFIGGCIAQEVIKLVTNQYLPIDNTLVYNAMSALTKSFKFSEMLEKV